MYYQSIESLDLLFYMFIIMFMQNQGLRTEIPLTSKLLLVIYGNVLSMLNG